MKKKNRKGLTLVELVIALALMGLVAAAALSALSIGTFGINATKQVLDVTMSDTDFATRISTSIRNSGTTFTIPEQSFNVSKLTAGWSYLGLMHHVDVPASMSHTGQAIPDADALVYIESVGEQEPDDASLPMNSVKIHTTGDGWFIMTILGHSYVDKAGITHNYSLVFEPTNPNIHVAQTVRYTFSSTGSNSTTIQTVLESVNALQVVYQGSENNPATALAFRSDFMSTSSFTSYTEARDVYGTVVMLMDVSGSMSTYKLAEPMKKAAKDFLDHIDATNEHMNALIVTFGTYASCKSHFSISNPTIEVVNIRQNLTALKTTIEKIKISGSTNLGDGVRAAYYRIKNYEGDVVYSRTAEAGNDNPLNPIFLVILSDGEMNYATYSKSPSQAYTGPLLYDDSGFSSNCKGMGENANSYGRPYFTATATMFKETYDPSVFIVNLNRGMKDADINTIKGVYGNNIPYFDASDYEEMDAAFNEINDRIKNQMWAFKGPRI